MSVIYVWDERWPGESEFARKHSFKGEHRFGFTVTRDSKMDWIVKQIRGLSQGVGQIKLLRICAHGNFGYVQLGKDGLTSGTAQKLGALKPYFSADPAARIEIHACGVASSTDIVKRRAGTPVRDAGGHLVCTPGSIDALDPKGRGMSLLRNINRATGTAVLAGVDCQQSDAEYKYEGTVVHAI